MRVNRTTERNERSTTWAAGLCAAALAAAGAVAAPAAGATTAAAPDTPAAEQVPTEVIASAEDLASLGTAIDAHLAGDNLFVEVRTATGTRRSYWRPLDGSRSWSKMWGGRVLTGDLLASEHDVLLLDVGTTDVLAWSRDGGGSRTVPEGTVLGQGGEHVAYLAEGPVPWPTAAVQPVTGGDLVPIWPTDSLLTFPEVEDGYALTDDSFYGIDGSQENTVLRWNTTTGYGTSDGGNPCRSVPGSTLPHVADARGRFALASCADGSTGLTADSAGVYTFVTLATRMDRTATPPRLGDGFVLGVSADTGELLAAPSLGDTPGTLGGAQAFDLNDAGDAVVLVDDGDVRLARDLEPWSSTMATEITDSVAPTVQDVSFFPAAPVTPGTGRFQVRVSADDTGTAPYRASGVAGTEVRARIRIAGETEFGDPVPVGADVPTEYPVGATVCWEGRALDRAGNVSDWVDGKCAVVPDNTNRVVALPLPPATKASGFVFFTYAGVDRMYFAQSDVRYRVFLRNQTPPEWTTVEDNGGGRGNSYTLPVPPNGHMACFQARGYDLTGAPGDWTPEECIYSDALEPRITSTAYPRWITQNRTSVVDGVRTANPTFTWVGADNFGIDGYFVQRSLSRDLLHAEEPVWTTDTSYTRPLTEGGQHCLRVRAKDLAGNLSPWSGWRCATMPVSADKVDGQSFGPYLHRVWPGKGDLITTRGYSGVAVYVRVYTGPRYGSMKVYMGSRYLGRVNAHALETGTRWVWLSTGEKLDGKVRFVADPGDFVDLREFYISR